MMIKKEKKKIQVNIDKDLAQDVDTVLENLGMNTTVLITALYKRVAAKKEIPFSLSLTEEEKVDIELASALNKVPTRQLDNLSEIEAWLSEDED